MDERNQDIITLLSDESFQRWLTGKASDEENTQWHTWLQSAPDHRELYAQAFKLWDMARFRPAALPDIEQEWQKLLQRLRRQSATNAAVYPLPSRRTFGVQEAVAHFPWVRFGAMAAAAVVLIALLWRFWPKQHHPGREQFQVTSTGYGERTRILLPDSTTVILNANSALRYPARWSVKTVRQVELHGEAYFDVSSSREAPQRDFTVHTRDGRVRVVGTRFVVYDRGQGTRVVVEEGGVEVAVADSASRSGAPVARVVLRPGNLVQFQKGDRTLHPRRVPVGVYTTWWRDRWLLEHTPVAEILRRVEETYGVEVRVSDPRLLQRTLSGAIENHSWEVILQALAKSLRVSVHQEGALVVLGNSPK